MSPPTKLLYTALWAVALPLAACGDGLSEAPPDDPSDAVEVGEVGADVGPGAPEVPSVGLAWCEGATEHVYDPLQQDALQMWPDDFYTRDDGSTPTGLRVVMNQEIAPWTADVSPLLADAIVELNSLSGFGRNAGAVMRFTAPVGALPSTGVDDWQDSLTSDALLLLDLGTDPPTRVPYEASTNDEGRDLIVWPLRPLRGSTLHALVVTDALKAADGECIRPSATTRALLSQSATDPALTRLQGRYQVLLERTGLDPAAISAATVFTTAGELDTLAAAAEDVRGGTYGWSEAPTCVEESAYRRCDGAFEAQDYRNDYGFVDFMDGAEPSGSWTLPVRAWLPREGEGPFPTVIFGHGLSGSRTSGGALAKRLAPLGFAVVAIDALEHGDHPTAEEEGGPVALKFLGISLADAAIRALVLRGNFNQSMLDRLQLIELLVQSPDIDGDGAPDVDAERMAYEGISLGGMMGAPLLAMSDRLQAGLLSVAGGRLLTFATDSADLEPYKPIIVDALGGESEYARLMTVAQALVDAADPATYAAHVLRDRYFGPAPDVLMHVAIADDTVPPVAGKALARALELPHLGTVQDPVRLLEHEPDLPVSANVAVGEGAVTAGFYQLDRVSSGGGSQPATHGNVPFSAEGELQTLHFFQTWKDTGRAEILDPLVDLATPPL